MNRILALALLLAPAAVFAQQPDDSIVQWERIVAVITAPGVDSPVAGIKAGAGPWTTRDGHARIDLLTGRASFDVEGLVLVGGNSSGTPGPVTTLNGTLVCSPLFLVRIGPSLTAAAGRWFGTGAVRTFGDRY
jgi:hypothetical protein